MLRLLPLLVLAVVAVRTVQQQSTSTASKRTWTGRSGRWLAVWLLAGPAWLGAFLWLLNQGPNLVATAVLAGTSVLLFPWPIVRRVLVPLGLVRSAWWLTRLADWTWGADPLGGAALAAVLAAGRAPAATSATAGAPLRWWRRQLARPASDLIWARQRLQGLDLLSAGGAMAAALLADIDGDHDSGDALAASLDSFDPQVQPTAAEQLRAERTVWRLMGNTSLDDAERRRRLLALEAHGSSTVALLQAVARRQDGPTRMNRAACIGWWLLAPRKRHTWALLQGTTTLPTSLPTSTVTDPASTAMTAIEDGVTFGGAARRHAELARAPVLAVVDVAWLARAWERALKEATATVRARARVLGVDGADAEGGLHATVHDALVGLVQRLDLSTVDVATLPTALQQAVADVRSQRMDALEIAVAAWRHRLEDGVDRQPVDELREWTGLRHLAAAVARTGDDGAWLANEASQWVVCELAVRLWNVRREHRLANAIFRSLLDDATRVGDTRSAETQKANVACGP